MDMENAGFIAGVVFLIGIGIAVIWAIVTAIGDKVEAIKEKRSMKKDESHGVNTVNKKKSDIDFRFIVLVVFIAAGFIVTNIHIGKVSSMQYSISQLRNDMKDIERKVGNIDTSWIESDINDIEKDIEDIKEELGMGTTRSMYNYPWY